MKYKLKAMTLIEVLVAMSIFAISIVALIQSASTNLNNMINIEDNMIASILASNQHAIVVLEKKWPSLAPKKEEVQMSGRTWYVQTSAKETSSDEFRAVIVEVFKNEDSKQPIYFLANYIYKQQ